jgi:hypothetical protein
MKKLTVLSLMALAFSAHAQSENDLLRSLSRADRHLNEIWNMRLTPDDRNALRADERRWVAWKDTLSLKEQEQAVWKRVDFLQDYAAHH